MTLKNNWQLLLKSLKEKALSPEELNNLITKELKNDSVLFSEVCLGFKNNWHHKIIYDILDNKLTQQWDRKKSKDFGKIIINRERKKNKKIVILAPRSHAKTQCVSINWVIKKIYQNPNIRILSVSNSLEQSSAFLRSIKAHLGQNDDLVDRLGSLVPKHPMKWTDKQIIVERTSKEKDPTVAVVGVFGAILSRRSDLILLDDVLDEDNTRTEKQRERVKFWFNNVLKPVMTPNAQLVVVGTAWFIGDLYDEFLHDNSFDIRLKLKALVHDSKYADKLETAKKSSGVDITRFPQAMDIRKTFSDEVIKKYGITASGRALWPEMWDYKRLMEEFRSGSGGSLAFYRAYLNEPVGEDVQVFKTKWIKRALRRGNKYTLLTEYNEKDCSFGQLTIAVGVDLAISKRKTSDDTAIAVWGMDDNGTYYLLDVEVGKWSPDETQTKVTDVNHHFRPYKIRVENVGFQDMLRSSLAAASLPVEGFHTSGASKFSPEIGINTMAALFERGKIIIPSKRNHEKTWKIARRLSLELAQYPGRHTGDLLMASWFAISALQELVKFTARERTLFDKKALLRYLSETIAPKKVNLVGLHPVISQKALTGLTAIFKKPEPEKSYFISARSEQEYSVAICFDVETKEVVAKLQGDLSAVSFATQLERFGHYYNKATLIVDKAKTGLAVLLEMQRRNYPRLACLRPTIDGLKYEVGWETKAENLPLAIDVLADYLNNRHLILKDKDLLRDISYTIDIEGDGLYMQAGKAIRVITLAFGLYLLKENKFEKKNKTSLSKAKKPAKIPYRVFNYASGVK